MSRVRLSAHERPASRPARRWGVRAAALTAATGVAVVLATVLASTSIGATSMQNKSIVIGWSQRGITGSDWWKNLIAGGQYEAKRLGVKLEVLDANRDTTQQNQDVQTLITRGVNGVIMNAQDPLGVSPAVHALTQAHIPFVEVNSNLAPSLAKDAFCYVAEDQVATGAKVGRVIGKDAIAKYGKSANVKLVAIGGYPGDVITGLRYKGFKQGYNSVVKKYPNFKTTFLPIRYGHWLPDQALPPIRDVATANPDLKIVYSESDVMQAGIQQALSLAGLWNTNILEGSYDGGMNGVQLMVKSTKGPMVADGANVPWDQGVVAVQMAVAAIKNHKAACPTGTNYIDTPIVTPANAKKYYNPKLTHVQIPPKKIKLIHAHYG